MYLVDPKKQIYISKFNADSSPVNVNKDGQEMILGEGHLKNMRKKDYYENRIKK